MLKVDDRDYTRKAIYKLFFHFGPLKKQSLGTIKIETDAKSLKKWRPIIMRLFENINIKHFNIMNSRKNIWKLIENITVQVPNMVSLSKDILFHVPKFLEKTVFQLMFEIIKWIQQLHNLWQIVPSYWHQIEQVFFDQNFTCFLKDVLVSKQKMSYLLDFDQIVYIHHEKMQRISFL